MSKTHVLLSPVCTLVSDQINGDSMRNILVVNSGSLLEQGLARLLDDKAGLSVVSTSFESEEILISDMNDMHPDVVIINRVSIINLPRLLGLLEGLPIFNHLQILGVGVDSNMVDVYEKREIYELQAQDFYDFLQGAAIDINIRVGTP